jgi:hypothetical protein
VRWRRSAGHRGGGNVPRGRAQLHSKKLRRAALVCLKRWDNEFGHDGPASTAPVPCLRQAPKPPGGREPSGAWNRRFPGSVVPPQGTAPKRQRPGPPPLRWRVSSGDVGGRFPEAPNRFFSGQFVPTDWKRTDVARVHATFAGVATSPSPGRQARPPGRTTGDRSTAVVLQIISPSSPGHRRSTRTAQCRR